MSTSNHSAEEKEKKKKNEEEEEKGMWHHRRAEKKLLAFWTTLSTRTWNGTFFRRPRERARVQRSISAVRLLKSDA